MSNSKAITQSTIQWSAEKLPLLAVSTLALLLFSASQATAQDSNDGSGWTGASIYQVNENDRPAWKVDAWTGAEYQGDTDLDGSGDFKFWMVGGGVNASRKAGDNVKVALKADYRAIGYDFNGVIAPDAGSVVEPWETVHVFRFNPIMTYEFGNSWSVLGGPIFEFSGEGKAQFSDSVRGGGLIGVGWKGERIFVAIGAIALTELEEDVRIQPFVMFDWAIAKGLSLGLKADTSRGGELRLGYAFNESISLSGGVGFRRERFRLNGDSGGLPAGFSGLRQDGIGEESSTVGKITMAWNLNERFTLEGYGGVTVGGEFRLENENGNKIRTEDYDSSGFGGLGLRMHF